jgi:hypothetical protein
LRAADSATSVTRSRGRAANGPHRTDSEPTVYAGTHEDFGPGVEGMETVGGRDRLQRSERNLAADRSAKRAGICHGNVAGAPAVKANEPSMATCSVESRPTRPELWRGTKPMEEESVSETGNGERTSSGPISGATPRGRGSSRQSCTCAEASRRSNGEGVTGCGNTATAADGGTSSRGVKGATGNLVVDHFSALRCVQDQAGLFGGRAAGVAAAGAETQRTLSGFGMQ